MRILQILMTRGVGGTERYFMDIVKGLAMKGHEVQAIIHPASPIRSHLDNVPGVVVTPLRLGGGYSFFNLLALKKLIKEFSPDLVEMHKPRSGLVMWLIRRVFSLPLVCRFHLDYRHKHPAAFNRVSALTHTQKDWLVSTGFDEGKIDVFPNFSGFPVVHRADIACSDRFVIFAYGRLVWEKGFDILLQALHDLVVDYPVTLILAGDGKMREELNQLCLSLDLEGHVEFVGWVDDVKPFLSCCDICVVPSRVEPFGLVILEAMASGVPVISTKTAGALSILNERVAWLCEVEDAQSLLSALREALPSTDEKAEVLNGKRRIAQQRFETEFSFDAIYPGILNHYQQAIASARIS